jgi:TolB-like protein/DNA-binding winged helix-turn-helix (wHTH) protein/Tfp pilus assembly protein PilF
MEPGTLGSVLRFGAFELDLSKEQLRKSGVRLKLRPQAFRVLALLASRAGDLVSREEIQKEIWNDDVVVDFDQGLNFCIRQIRSALGDNADVPRFIETIPRRGYRFLVSVQPLDWPQPKQAPSKAEAATPLVEPPPPDPSVQIDGAPIQGSSRRGRRILLASSIAALGLAALVLLAFVSSRRLSEQSPAGAHIRALAVLPFVNLSGDPRQEFFADGMTEALIERLSSLRDVRVVSRTSVMHFKQSGKPVPAIAKELKVDAVLEGAVLRSSERVRISVRLVRGTDRQVWSSVYDRRVSDVLSLQSELARAITRQIENRLVDQLNTVPEVPHKVAPHVYESYLKGRFLLNKGDRAAVAESATYLEQAVADDPDFAQAYSALGLAYTVFGRTSTAVSPVTEALPKALAAARKALELDPNLAEAHMVLAYALEQDWRWDEAETEYRRAIELEPNNAFALRYLGELLVVRMRTEEGLELARRARELDPLTLYHSALLGWQLYHARRYDEAARELRTALALDPNHRPSLWYLGFVLIEKQQFDEAIKVLERAALQSERNPAELGVLARAYARAGRRADALRIVDELTRRRRDGYVSPSPLVHAYLGLENHDQAFVWLERAFQEHANLIRYLRTHPAFDSLRSDRRFTSLLRRAGLS